MAFIKQADCRVPAVWEKIGKKDGCSSFHTSICKKLGRQHRCMGLKACAAERAGIFIFCKRGRRRQYFRFSSRFFFRTPTVCYSAGAACYGMSPDLDRTFSGFTIWQYYSRVKGFLLEIQHFITPVNQTAVACRFFD